MSNYKVLTDTEKTDSVKKDKKYRSVKLGIDYASAIAFKARKDTAKLYSFSPYFKYSGKYGFFTKINIVDVPGTKKGFDELNTSFGWDFNFSQKWDGSIGYAHYFYNSKVARIKAAISNEISANVSYDWDFLYSYLGVDLDGGNNKFPYNGKMVSKKTRDYYLVFSNSHEFSFDFFLKRVDDLTVTPGMDILFGTQNFLVTYKGKTDPTNITYQQKASKFNLTGIMLDLEIKYRIKKLTILLYPEYTFPKNVPTGESTKPYFVMNAGIYFTFKQHK